MRQQDRARLRTTTSGRTHEAPHTDDQDREVHERLKRGRRPVHPVAQPPEALEPAQCPLNHLALSLEPDAFGNQFASGLTAWDAGPGGNQWPVPALLHKAAKTKTVVALVG